MTSMEASERQRRNLKTFLSIAGGAAAVFAVCLLAREFWGPGSATAQAPNRQPGKARTVPAPAARGNATTRSARRAVSRPVGNQSSPRNVVATVNGQQIPRPSLASECLRRYGQEVLESMVNKHLILQACEKRGITITKQDVENEIEQMAAKFGLATDRWLTMLERERDISPDRYRREIIWPTLALRRLARQQIVVSDEELKQAFESQYGPKVKARMIVLNNKQKAAETLRRAKAAPEKFGELAKEVSEDANTAAARGIIPPIRKHIGHQALETAAFALEEDQISEIIPVGDQHIILKCEKQLPETYISSKNLPQIEGQLRDQLRDKKLRSAAQDIFAKLQSEAQVVNVLNDDKLRQRFPGVAAKINGRQVPIDQVAEECLLRYGEEVLDGEINRLVLKQELKRRNKTVTNAGIDAEIARAAESYGYVHADGSPDVETWLKTVTETDQVTVDLYIRDAVWPSVALKQLVSDEIEVTQEDLKKGFASNYGERVEVLAIVLGNQRQANEVWDLARHNPTNEFFGELANQYSVEPVSRANFGKVPPIRRYGGQPIMEEEAFGLKPNAGAASMSGILNVGDKFVILRCIGRTEPIVQDFNVVKDELYQDIHEKKLRLAMADEFDRLKEAAQIDNFLAGTSQSGRRGGSTRSTDRKASPAGFSVPGRAQRR